MQCQSKEKCITTKASCGWPQINYGLNSKCVIQEHLQTNMAAIVANRSAIVGLVSFHTFVFHFNDLKRSESFCQNTNLKNYQLGAGLERKQRAGKRRNSHKLVKTSEKDKHQGIRQILSEMSWRQLEDRSTYADARSEVAARKAQEHKRK